MKKKIEKKNWKEKKLFYWRIQKEKFLSFIPKGKLTYKDPCFTPCRS